MTQRNHRANPYAEIVAGIREGIREGVREIFAPTLALLALVPRLLRRVLAWARAGRDR